MNNQKGIASIIILVLAAIIGGGILVWQNFETPKEEIEISEKLVENETANWEIYRNEEYGFEFKYPEIIDQKYIGEYQWPPQTTVRPFDPNFFCENLEMVETPIGYGNQKEVIFNDSKYCVLTVSEGTAGTAYVTYNYVVQKDDKYLTLEFILTFSSCGAFYPDNKMKECTVERENFDPINIVDKILTTFRFIERNKPSISILSPREKCENSGGLWTNPCETGECYECSCNLTGGERPHTFKVLKEGECTSCFEDRDCGINFCEQARNMCIEYKYFCDKDKGICLSDIIYYDGGYIGPKTHNCINNECIPCGDACLTK